MLHGGIQTDVIPYFQTLKPSPDVSRVIIDVGANTGAEVVAAVKAGWIVYAFEPLPSNFEKIKEQFERNNLTYYVCDTPNVSFLI